MQAAHMTFEEEAIKSRSIIKRLTIENTNLRKSNESLKKKIVRLEKENLLLKKENRVLQERQSQLLEKQVYLEKHIESLSVIVEELRGMIFGKKKSKDERDGNNGESKEAEGGNSGEESSQAKKRKSANRSKMSYRRAVPPDDQITDTLFHPLTHCPDCGTLLIAIKQIIRYTEDLVDLTHLAKLLKRIEKHVIGSGYCSKCKRRKTAKDISPQMSSLGENVKKFVCYLSIIMRLSFKQITCFFKDTADFAISDGEITVCLDEQAEKLRAEKDRLFAKIRSAPGRHYDETSWNVQKEGLGNYAWISRPTTGEETIFLMGRSRGKGNAEELRGEVDNQVGITDDYGAYDNLFVKHQLCIAHPQRKLRELSQSKTLSETSKTACDKTYESFKKLYAQLEETLATEYDKELWLTKRDAYIKRLEEIAIITKNDPQKLKTIKQTLYEKAAMYFTCLTQPGIPADNNKAERGLRHIVLKRKISYGSQSQKGAETMSILCSTMLSCWWNKPENFFIAYNQMLPPYSQ